MANIVNNPTIIKVSGGGDVDSFLDFLNAKTSAMYLFAYGGTNSPYFINKWNEYCAADKLNTSRYSGEDMLAFNQNIYHVQLDCSHLSKLSYLCSTCQKLQTMKLYNGNMLESAACYAAFSGCFNLYRLEMDWTPLPTSTTSLATSNMWDRMFYQTSSLRTIVFKNMAGVDRHPIATISALMPSNTNYPYYSWEGQFHYLYNPRGESTKIYVPDEYVDSLKSQTNWSAMADHLYPLTELPAEDTELYKIEGARSTDQPYNLILTDRTYSFSTSKQNHYVKCWFYVPENAQSRTLIIHMNTTLASSYAKSMRCMPLDTEYNADSALAYAYKKVDAGQNVDLEIVFNQVPAGDHFVIFGYADGGSSSQNMQFTIEFVE